MKQFHKAVKKDLFLSILPIIAIAAVLGVTLFETTGPAQAQQEDATTSDQTMCTMEYDPVCGEDGDSYTNSCFADVAGVEIAYEGECEEEQESKQTEEQEGGGEKACKTDETCEWVSVNCCPENAGAQWECVNSDETDLDCSENPICPQVISPKPEEPCVCVDEECQTEEQRSEDEEENEGEKDEAVDQIKEKARKLFLGDIESLLQGLEKQVGESGKQGLQKAQDKIAQARERSRQHLGQVEEKLKQLNENARNAIDTFVGYGVDKNTRGLGAGERAAVVHSFEKAFNKLPETEEEVEDMVKISNGRWPSKKSEKAEEKAKEKFQDVYDRKPNLEQPHDEAAITVMAYGLRQRAENRNLESEERGIRIFKNIFGHTPESTEDWNVMQAITYSGASK